MSRSVLSLTRSRPHALTPLLGVCLLSSILLCDPLHAEAGEANVLFVLDLSGSMWGRVEGRPKIEIAREVMGEVLRDLPGYVAVGLVVYGHRSREDCEDIELVSPVGESAPDELARRIDALQPRGQTPLSRALLTAYDEVSTLPGTAHVVLVSDGEETCGGDPCQLMSDLRATGSRVAYHVIGFDVTAEERDQLECIASAGRGDYYAADSAEDLTRALATVRRKVLERVDPD